jgi:hypothetical protein
MEVETIAPIVSSPLDASRGRGKRRAAPRSKESFAVLKVRMMLPAAAPAYNK